MAEHTPGPWKVMAPTQSGGALGEAEDRGITGESPEGNVVLAETWMYDPGIDGRKITLPASANAERIVACVNACEGIEDPSDLEAEHLRDMLDCQERIVNLLEAAREVMGWVRPCPDCEGAGTDPILPGDACHRCGGYGEGVYGDIMEAVFEVRVAIAREEKESTE